MKLLKIRWLLLITIVAAGFGGVVGSNVGCGGSDNKSDAGGSGGGGGTGGGGGVTLRYSNTFDTDKQGWTLSDYPDMMSFNWGATLNPDSGVGLDGGVAPTFAWNGTDGDPSPGCLKVTVTFTGFMQYVDPQVNVATPVDMTGHPLKARVRLVSGSFPAGGIQFHASSGLTGANAYVYAAAPFINSTSLTVGTWITISLDPDTLSSFDGRPFDPTQIVQIGVQFTTGSPFEGGVPTFGDAVFEIDTVQG